MNYEIYPSLNERVYKEVLSNGLTMAVVPRPGFARKLAYFVTDFGSIHREFTFEGRPYAVPAGIAHFLEHKMFDMPDGRDISAELAELGASVNAFTSYDMTAYYFSCTQHFEKCLDILLQFVSTPCFTKESVEKELGIIDQEIGMNADAPESKVFEYLMESMYRHHDIRTPILGDSDSIRKITPELLHACHQAFYTPANMILCVVGDVDPEQVKKQALAVLGAEKRPVGIKKPMEPEELTCPVAYRQEKMDVAMPTFQVAFKCLPLGKGEEAVRQELVADLAAEALFGESSVLYPKMYEQGIIDSSFGGGFETVDGCAMLTCGGDSHDPAAVLDAIVQRGLQIAREGIDEKDFLRMKRSAMGRRIRDLDSFDSTCFRLCAYHFSDSVYFRFPAMYEAVAEAEMRDFLANAVRTDNCSLTRIDPITEGVNENEMD